MPPLLEEPACPATRQAVARLTHRHADLSPSEIDGAVSYHQRGQNPRSGPRIVLQPSGHRVFYDEQGQRVLCVDPSGTILHECEWTHRKDGTIRLARARVRLDSLLWIGLLPEATTHQTVLNVSRRAGWPAPTADDLRRMAAQAWGAPLDDLNYFYPDGSFEWGPGGTVTIHLKKDGLFLLGNGTFAHPRFISYMGTMPWARIDLLNVVELFQSALAGTGSAVLELIWGLCDDQRRTHGLIPLRYRGLPTYPSEQAYGLFSAFFRPETPTGESPHKLFMDRHRANQITWWLRHDPPWRYFNRTRRLAVTVQGGTVQKVTVIDDPVGVPYIAPGTRGGFAPCERTVVVEGGRLQLRDGEGVRQLELDPSWHVAGDTQPHPSAVYPFGWRAFFGVCPPPLDPARVHQLALLYPSGDAPDEEAEVAELSTQPFVLEQLCASLNGLDQLRARLARIRNVLIDGFDAVAAGCVDLDYFRTYTLLYRSPEWAQKQAQVLWDQAAQTGRLEAVRETRFIPLDGGRDEAYGRAYDLLYCWVPFSAYRDMGQSERMISAVCSALTAGGLALIMGPRDLRVSFASYAVRLRETAGVEDLARLPLLTEHQRLHPRTRLNPALAVFLIEKE